MRPCVRCVCVLVCKRESCSPLFTLDDGALDERLHGDDLLVN